MSEPGTNRESLNFIESIVEKDLKEGKNKGIVHTRFPPEPNGYLHIGHAKSICLNFGIAEKYNGNCNLRFDDTNPEKEEEEYVQSILNDIKWLGFKLNGKPLYASGYFDQLYKWAKKLIEAGKAYVDDQTAEEIAKQKGTPTHPGTESPFRSRGVEENLKLFRDMKSGKYKEGERILRAKIDMASPNMHLRDPIMYRIMHKEHHRTGKKWCIYPMYDFTHGQSDYIEGITHSLCTLEFEVHRPLYNWFLDNIYDENFRKIRPRQIEFARLNLSYTVMSKRKLLELVEKEHVNGWDDPRMPTISGLRRRGYTPESIRHFSDLIGVAKRDNIIDVALLEYSLKEDLNKKAPRKMAVLDPIKVVITNFPENKKYLIGSIDINPELEIKQTRKIRIYKEIFIEKADFMEDPPKKFFRLGIDREVRLKGAFIIKCHKVSRDDDGSIKKLFCTYDPDTRSGKSSANRKVKGTLHWVSAPLAVNAKVRLYDRLFNDEDPAGHKETDFKEFLNPDSLKIVTAKVEPSLANAKHFDHFQFQRIGYFNVDPDSVPGHLVFNRTVPLRDSWGKLAGKGKQQ